MLTEVISKLDRVGAESDAEHFCNTAPGRCFEYISPKLL